MKFVRIEDKVFLRHWNKWYVIQEGAAIDRPVQMVFEGFKPFWEGTDGLIDELVPDFTNQKIQTEGKRRARTKTAS